MKSAFLIYLRLPKTISHPETLIEDDDDEDGDVQNTAAPQPPAVPQIPKHFANAR